ncbi:MAG: hypothetical protein QM759_06680 [Terricaulis sp.]
MGPSRVYDADFEEVSEQRCGDDRREASRRAAKQHLDTLFAATLLNQVQSPETIRKFGYRTPQKLRAGIAFDLKA